MYTIVRPHGRGPLFTLHPPTMVILMRGDDVGEGKSEGREEEERKKNEHTTRTVVRGQSERKGASLSSLFSHSLSLFLVLSQVSLPLTLILPSTSLSPLLFSLPPRSSICVGGNWYGAPIAFSGFFKNFLFRAYAQSGVHLVLLLRCPSHRHTGKFHGMKHVGDWRVSTPHCTPIYLNI